MHVELVLRAQRGDEQAFTRLLAPVYERLHQIAYRMLRDRSLAEEAVQQAALRMPGNGRFQLAKFDGSTFDRVDTTGSAGPSRSALRLDVSAQNVLADMAEAPDGTLWVQRWQRHDDVLYVWSWDGIGWTEYGPIETRAGAAWSEVWAGIDRGGGTQMGIWFGPDGSMWFDGLVHFDGERFTALDAPSASADGTTRVDAISVASDGTIWIVMVSRHGGRTSAEGLYAITPDVVASTG